MNIDWSKAPEGATHFDAADNRINSFMKLEGGRWCFWPPNSQSPAWTYWRPDNTDIKGMIPRPTEWNGEGLPPVGTVCEAKMPPGLSLKVTLGWEWRKVEVVKSGMSGAENECLVFDLETTRPAWVDEFRPIRTPEQIAAEERERAIADLYFTINWNEGRETWPVISNVRKADYAKAIDAGYRKQVSP